jgi:DNA-binding SARP family transcriptional activator
MENTPYIVLIGGASNQVRKIKAIAWDRFALLEFPANFDQHLHEIENLAGNVVIFFFHNPANEMTQALSQLKERFPKLPVVMVGKSSTRKDIIRAFRHGVDDFLIWPAEEKEVLFLLERYLSGSQYSPQRTFRNWWRKISRLLGLPKPGRQSRYPHADTLGISFHLPFPMDLTNDVRDQYDLNVRFFGRFELIFRGKKMKPLPGKKVTSLFAYLLYHHSKPIHREKLMAQFWGDNTPSSARNSLNVAIHTIRKHFHKICPHQEIILYHRETYVLNPELDILTDIDQFIHYWQWGREIEARQGLNSAMGAYNKAVALYRGDLLEDMLYEEWCESERDSAMEIYLLTLDRMSSFFLNECSYTATINLCKKILEKDDCLEDGHRRLIVCYDRLGMRDKAIRQYHKCARILKNELSVEPSDETKKIFVEISEG